MPSGDQPETLVVPFLSLEGLNLFFNISLRGSLRLQQSCCHGLRPTRLCRVNSKGFFLTAYILFECLNFLLILLVAFL